jgi:hypothetical protein
MDDQRKQLQGTPIVWTGDLDDDCSAHWGSLLLRAEWMDEDYWWWSVYDMKDNERQIDTSNEYDHRFIGGKAARDAAERSAKKYLGIE